MEELYLKYPNRETIQAVRLENGQLEEKYALKTFESEESINGLFLKNFIIPREQVFENEEKLLKKVYETESVILEGKWIVQNKQSTSQPSFILTNVVDGGVSLEYE